MRKLLDRLEEAAASKPKMKRVKFTNKLTGDEHDAYRLGSWVIYRRGGQDKAWRIALAPTGHNLVSDIASLKDAREIVFAFVEEFPELREIKTLPEFDKYQGKVYDFLHSGRFSHMRKYSMRRRGRR